MPHTYTSTLMHCVWSTKDRLKTILPSFRDRLWAYLGGIARTNKMVALGVGGTANHTHMLISLPAVMPVAKAVQLIKGGSSKWVNDTCKPLGRFEWQSGYGAFSIGHSQIDATLAYIRGQEEHHRVRSFKEEFRAFLKKHHIEYDERYVWG